MVLVTSIPSHCIMQTVSKCTHLYSTHQRNVPPPWASKNLRLEKGLSPGPVILVLKPSSDTSPHGNGWSMSHRPQPLSGRSTGEMERGDSVRGVEPGMCLSVAVVQGAMCGERLCMLCGMRGVARWGVKLLESMSADAPVAGASHRLALTVDLFFFR